MKIEEINFVPTRPHQGLIGFCSLVLDGLIHLSGIAVYSRPAGGYRLVFPTKRAGEKHPIFYPIRSDFGKTMEEKVSEHIEKVRKMYDRHHSPDIRRG